MINIIVSDFISSNYANSNEIIGTLWDKPHFSVREARALGKDNGFFMLDGFLQGSREYASGFGYI
jgi:hypothetical protein